MRRFIKLLTASVICLSTLVACGPGGLSNQQGGTLTGAAIGGVVGNQFGHGSGRAAATVGGAILGGFLGSRVGRSMDQADQHRVEHAMHSGRSDSWSSHGNHYRVNPNSTYITQDGRMCRRFTLTDNTGARLNGVACCRHLHQGKCTSWKIVK